MPLPHWGASTAQGACCTADVLPWRLPHSCLDHAGHRWVPHPLAHTSPSVRGAGAAAPGHLNQVRPGDAATSGVPYVAPAGAEANVEAGASDHVVESACSLG